MKRCTLLIAGVVLPLLSGVASACPMCKDSIPNSDAQSIGGLPSGFNSSVYLMLIAFFASLALISGVLWQGVRTTHVRSGFPIEPKQSDENKK